MPGKSHGDGSVYPDPQRGDGHWIVSVEAGWTRNGTRKRIRRRVIGTERDAHAVRRQLLRDPSPTMGRAVTVKTCADEWLESRERTVRPAAFVADRSAVKWIVQTIGHKRLATLTPGDVRAVGNAILEAGRAPGTAIRYRAVLDKLLTDARTEGHHVPPTVFDVAAIPKGEGERDTLDLESAQKLVLAIEQRADASRWLLAMLHGVRPAECLGLTWDHVDLEAGVVTIEWQLKPLPYRVRYDRSSGFRVPTGYTARHLVHSFHLVRPKTGSGRRQVALHPAVLDALSRWQMLANPSPYGLVWPRPDGLPMADDKDRERWAALCKTAGVPPVDLYAARHAAATLARGAGADDQTITAMMGHSSILSSLPYMHHADLERQRAVSHAVAERLGLNQ